MPKPSALLINLALMGAMMKGEGGYKMSQIERPPHYHHGYSGNTKMESSRSEWYKKKARREMARMSRRINRR